MNATGRKLRQYAEHVYLKTPYPLSKLVYRMGRSYLFRDTRQGSFADAFSIVAQRGIEGDYLEFGCYRGASLILAFEEARRHRLDKMRFFGFDSFEGLPESEGQIFRQGDYSCSVDEFHRYLRKAGVDLSRVIAVKGLFEATLQPELKRRHGLRRVAIAQVDCNLYSSTKVVLSFIEDLLDSGTVIIFDDWYRADPGLREAFGERKAFFEWPLSQNCRPYGSDNGPAGKTFLFSGDAANE